jgi:predicted transcriptional regulator
MNSQTVQVPRDLIRKKLRELRYSMKDLAESTNIPYNTMNAYLNGYTTTIPLSRMNDIMNQIQRWEE